MTKRKGYNKTPFRNQPQAAHPQQPATPQLRIVSSLLDQMIEGHEFESILNYSVKDLELISEIRRAIQEISNIRKRPIICYLANMVNDNIKSSISIEPLDDLPFSEMVKMVNKEQKDVDIILVTPGGRADQVARFVDNIRPRFENVVFILPYLCMSAGTIFCLSGDDIIMDERAYIGPIDPQVPSRNGIYVPAQALQTLISDIQERGQQKLEKGQHPDWTDLQILNSIDARELGNALSASKYSIELATNYVNKYKLKNWILHESTGEAVTEEERCRAAENIASKLCDHKAWKVHSRGISRELAFKQCGLKITYPENTPELLRAIRRFWALIYWIFEKTSISKIFVSENYSIVRQDVIVPNH